MSYAEIRDQRIVELEERAHRQLRLGAILVYPPDRRARDLDNLGKALLDALTKAGVYGDDSQIDHLTFARRKNGTQIIQI